MSQHILEWLPAYYDGELGANRQRQVEKHLQTCPDCRAELDALEALSGLLKTEQVPGRLQPDRFTAQVLMLLPHRKVLAGRQQDKSLPYWVLGAPLALVAGWAFLQAALGITVIIMGADWVLGLHSLPWFVWNTPEGLVGTISSLLVLNFGLLVGTTILWAAWLALWWAWKNQIIEIGSNRIQKGV